MSELAAPCEMPGAACLFEETALSKSCEVVGDGFFIDGVEQVFDAMGGCGGAETFKVSDGDEDGVRAVGDDIAFKDLESFIRESVKELAGLVATELVNGPANAAGLFIGGGFRVELVNGVRDLVDVLVTACTCDAFALGVAWA